MAQRGWARQELPMGAGRGGTPTLQLHAHAGTVSPTGTRSARRVTPRHKRAHAGTPAPTAPWRGPAHGAVPTRPLLTPRARGDTRTPAQRGRRHVWAHARPEGPVLAVLARLPAVVLRLGFGGSHTAAGSSRTPTAHARRARRRAFIHTHIQQFSCTRMCTHTHTIVCMLPLAPSPTRGSRPARFRAARGGRSQVWPHTPVTQTGPAPPAPAPLSLLGAQAGSCTPIPPSQPPRLPPHARPGRGTRGVQRWRTGRKSRGEPEGCEGRGNTQTNK